MSKGDTGRWLRQLLTPSKAENDMGREYLSDPDIHVVLRAKYLYIAYMRDLCESLSLEVGFCEGELNSILGWLRFSRKGRRPRVLVLACLLAKPSCPGLTLERRRILFIEFLRRMTPCLK